MVAVAVTAPWEFGWDALVALGTIGLALFTAGLAWSTRSLAAASAEDQRAQWRPLVIAAPDNEVGVSTDPDGRPVLSVAVRNVGRGPAFAVQAQVRSGKWALGASRPRSMSTLVPGEVTVLESRVVEDALRDRAAKRQPFPPALVEIEVAYYDVTERWHQTYLTATRSRDDDGLRVQRTLVEESDRRLLPVHGSRRAQAEAERRDRRPWRRARRAIRRAAAAATARLRRPA